MGDEVLPLILSIAWLIVLMHKSSISSRVKDAVNIAISLMDTSIVIEVLVGAVEGREPELLLVRKGEGNNNSDRISLL